MTDYPWDDPDRACAPPIGATPQQEGFHVDTWFPRKVSDGYAAAMCKDCPLATKAACLEWALEHDEVGIWGGMSEEGRRRLRGAVA